MIQQFNRKQVLLGTLNLLACSAALWLTWWFFCFADTYVRRTFFASVSGWSFVVATGAVALLLLLGILQWRRGEGRQRALAETAFSAALRSGTNLGNEPQLHLQRIGGWSYLISQLFLAGPRQLCLGLARFRRRLPLDPELERRMTALLARVQAVGKWEDARKYEDEAPALEALIRCGRVEFSPSKFRVKAAGAPDQSSDTA